MSDMSDNGIFLTEIVDYIRRKEKAESMGEVQWRNHGQLTQYEDVTILQNRAGNADRARTVKHIKDSEQSGHISAQEATARLSHAATAETHSDLRALTDDLPAPVDRRSYWEKRDWDEPQYFLPALLTGMFLSLCSAVVPGTVLGVMHKLGTAAGQAVFFPLLILGVIGVITSLTLIVIKTCE